MPSPAHATQSGRSALAERVAHLRTSLQNICELLELARGDVQEAALRQECVADLHRLSVEARQLCVDLALHGTADECFVEVHAGAGGRDSMNWAALLCRMYERWAERRGADALCVESSGDGDLLHSACLRVAGPHVLGWLQGETGVHRLVRISPYNADGKRQTSFVAVHVHAPAPAQVAAALPAADLLWDTMRASGAGGQHVNRTESAVRVVHRPTGLAVACAASRSQHRNRALALALLQARLAGQRAAAARQEQRERHRAAGAAGFGAATVRTYVLHPYSAVRCARTETNVANAQAVLDGELDALLEAALLWRLRSPPA